MSQSQNFPRGSSVSADDSETFAEGVPVAGEAVEVHRLDGGDGGTATPPASGGDGADSGSQSSLGDAASKGKEALSGAKDKAAEVSGQAHAKADEGMTKAAEGVGQAADMLRQRGEQTGGTVGTAATTVADKLDSAGSYLQEKDTDQLLQDLESLIRRKPVESLLVAAGAGFVLSKLFS
jgi:ElaB/YqjD/DUF883 family membrane-anchored ribosome-binding protein